MKQSLPIELQQSIFEWSEMDGYLRMTYRATSKNCSLYIIKNHPEAAQKYNAQFYMFGFILDQNCDTIEEAERHLRERFDTILESLAGIVKD